MILISRRGAQGPKTLFPFHKAIKILSLHCTYSQNGTRRAELHFYLIIFYHIGAGWYAQKAEPCQQYWSMITWILIQRDLLS